jgi:hypothetical protein
MADYNRDDLNVENLTETKSQRAPVLDRADSSARRIGGTRWPVLSGIAALGSLVLLGLAAWKLVGRATRDLFGSDSDELD